MGERANKKKRARLKRLRALISLPDINCSCILRLQLNNSDTISSRSHQIQNIIPLKRCYRILFNFFNGITRYSRCFKKALFVKF